VLPLVMAMLLGIFTGGTAYFQKISLVDAVREGARYGASLQKEAGSGGLTTWKQNVTDRVVQLSGGQLAAGDVCVALVTPTGSDTTCGVSDPPGAQADPTTLAPASLVKVAASRTTTIEVVFFTSTPTLKAGVAARYERDVV
jgi:Flp pilus assembly protein TadG